MIAPVPYSASTKLATQIGTGSPVNGLIAVPPGVEAFLLDLAGHAARRGPARGTPRPARGTPPDPATLGREPLDQRMLGREQHEGRAVDRVDARREDLDRVVRLAGHRGT